MRKEFDRIRRSKKISTHINFFKIFVRSYSAEISKPNYFSVLSFFLSFSLSLCLVKSIFPTNEENPYTNEQNKLKCQSKENVPS